MSAVAMAEEDHPALPAIRTSTPNRACSFHSITSSGSLPHSLAHRLQADRAVRSPPSSSSHDRSSSNLLPKCPPTKHGGLNGSGAAGRLKCGGAWHGGSRFRSFATFPGAQGSISAAAAAAAASSHSSASPHGHGACRGHLIGLSALAMIPAAGKKKSSDYLCHEPTSPEVTCIGTVRRSRHRDALSGAGNGKNPAGSQEVLDKKQPSKKTTDRNISREAAMDLQLAAPIPKPVRSNPPSPPKWRKIVSMLKDIRDLRAPHLQTRKLKLQAMVMQLDKLGITGIARGRVAVSAMANQITAANAEANAGSCGDEEDEQSSAAIAQGDADELDCSALQAMAMAALPPATLPPPSACLLLMRSKSRNKVFDEDHGSADCKKEREDENDHGETAAIDITAPASFKAIAMPASKASACPSSAEPGTKWIKRPALRFWRSKS